MRPTITAEDERSLSMDAQVALRDWLGEILGQPVEEALVRSVTLGEGFIDCERYRLDENGESIVTADGTELETFVERYPCASLPPVWLS